MAMLTTHTASQLRSSIPGPSREMCLAIGFRSTMLLKLSQASCSAPSAMPCLNTRLRVCVLQHGEHGRSCFALLGVELRDCGHSACGNSALQGSTIAPRHPRLLQCTLHNCWHLVISQRSFGARLPQRRPRYGSICAIQQCDREIANACGASPSCLHHGAGLSHHLASTQRLCPQHRVSQLRHRQSPRASTEGRC